MSRKQLLVKDRKTALYLGFAAYGLGALLLWDAFEHRGKGRPFWTRVASGLV